MKPESTANLARDDEGGRSGAASRILEGVPRVGYDIRFCTLPGSVESVMRYLGEPVDYDELMGVSGLAFRRLWNKDDGGNVGPLRFSPECVRRIFRALGYDHKIISYQRGRGALLDALKESMDRGIPVLASGIVGPPECEVVTGYTDGGDVLHGWSYFQDATKPGYYARPSWYENAEWANGVGVIVIGSRHPGAVPSRRELLESTLRWAIDLERKPARANVPDHVSGLAAYSAMERALAIDSDYAADDSATMATRCMVLADQAVMTEERGCAARFLRKMADAVPPVAEHLRAAASLYEYVGNEAGPIYPWGGDQGPVVRRKLSDPVTRVEIAKHVRAAHDAEANAVALLEKALAELSQKGTTI